MRPRNALALTLLCLTANCSGVNPLSATLVSTMQNGAVIYGYSATPRGGSHWFGSTGLCRRGQSSLTIESVSATGGNGAVEIVAFYVLPWSQPDAITTERRPPPQSRLDQSDRTVSIDCPEYLGGDAEETSIRELVIEARRGGSGPVASSTGLSITYHDDAGFEGKLAIAYGVRLSDER